MVLGARALAALHFFFFSLEFEIELRSWLAVIPFGEMFELAPSQQRTAWEGT